VRASGMMRTPMTYEKGCLKEKNEVMLTGRLTSESHVFNSLEFGGSESPCSLHARRGAVVVVREARATYRRFLPSMEP